MRHVLIIALLATGCGQDPADDSAAPDVCDDTITWESFAEGFIQTQCLPCHTQTLTGVDRRGAPPGVDFDSYGQTVQQLSQITARATGATPTMPPAGGVSDEDRQRLLDWILCDAPGADDALAGCEVQVRFDGSSTITGPDSAADLCGGGVTVLGGDLVLSGSTAVDCLCEVEGDVVFVNGAAQSLALPRLESIGGDLMIRDNTLLDAVSMPALTSLGGSLTVQQDSVRTLSVPQLLSIGGELRADNNLRLTNLDVVRVRQISGDVSVQDNPQLLALPTASVDAVDGGVNISGNDSLVQLDVFENAVRIGGDIQVVRNNGLTSLDGFTYLTDLGGSIEVRDNGNLVQMTGFQNLWTHPFALSIVDNPRLERMQSFVNLHSAGPVLLQGNRRLWDINGFESLQAVDGLVIALHLNLATLGGLEQLTEVSGDLEIRGNGNLADLRPLFGLTWVSGDVMVTDNPVLSGAEVSSWGLNLGVENVGGSVTVSGNGP